jgi:hypothetical protein
MSDCDPHYRASALDDHVLFALPWDVSPASAADTSEVWSICRRMVVAF